MSTKSLTFVSYSGSCWAMLNAFTSNQVEHKQQVKPEHIPASKQQGSKERPHTHWWRRVINGMQSGELRGLFNPESVFLSTHGGGAGNNWASGHSQAAAAREDILDMLDREARDADSLQGFLFTHSIAGGTGSGMGSLLLELLADHFPKALVHAYSVFPHKSDDVVVEPYNSVLTLKRLKHHAHGVTVLDNLALDALAAAQLAGGGGEAPTVAHMNGLVAAAMAAATAPLRFPGATYSSIAELLGQLVPAPNAHFLSASIAPVAAAARASSVSDVLRRLLLPRSRLASQPSATAAAATGRQLGALAILQGDAPAADVREAVRQARAARSLTFAASRPHNTLQVLVATGSPYVPPPHRVSGLLLSNSSAMRHVFDRTLSTYDLLMQRKPFVAEYCKFPMFYSGEGRHRIPDLAEFDDSREELAALSATYRAFEAPPAEE
eukprot:CAMPEP_0206150194 /NCGR_PEP_ID=MMETSP1473-20131121/38170_1 /ASSEMBLY_ACC=CAM_ASM_001109 /TAXON_ID=1461547 /ORGANISM="Stichococcus sp, Strain RCC1054" /LENGTH=437 /DNA_ID=CAMNT_0053547687 /DNA_START=1933 /DNA_END=3247 /DNA_ORIENTATION=+